MSQVRKALGPLGLALLPICCLGVPLLIAAGVSVAALALIAGITLAVIVGAALIVLLIVRGAPTRCRGAGRQRAREERGGADGSAE